MTPAALVIGVLERLPTWQGIIVILGVSLLVAFVLQRAGDRAIAKITAVIPGEVDDIVLQGIHPALYLSVMIAGIFGGVVFYDISPRWRFAAKAAAISLITIVWAISLSRIGREVSDELTENKYLDEQIVPIIQNLYSAIIVIVALFLILAAWKVNITPLLASAGVIGIILGLAARDTIANFFGSIALYLDGTYNVGDYVVLETGERGRVVDVSVRSTVIRTRDEILVTVPNWKLNSDIVINESSPGQKRRIRVPVGVAYGTDVDQVEEALEDIAEATDNVLDQPSPRVRFRKLGDSALEFELLCWIPNPAIRARVIHNLNKAIYERFRGDSIEIPFPQRDVTVTIDDSPDLPE